MKTVENELHVSRMEYDRMEAEWRQVNGRMGTSKNSRMGISKRGHRMGTVKTVEWGASKIVEWG